MGFPVHHTLYMPFTKHMLISLALEETPLCARSREGFRGDIAGQTKPTGMAFQWMPRRPTQFTRQLCV